MKRIYRKAAILKCDFNKVAQQLYWNHTLALVSPVNLFHIFKIPFRTNTSGRLLLHSTDTLKELSIQKRKQIKNGAETHRNFSCAKFHCLILLVFLTLSAQWILIPFYINAKEAIYQLSRQCMKIKHHFS